MPSTSEKSFGQRYTKAQELVEYLNTLSGYSPGIAEIEAPEIKTFLESVDAANSDAASKLSDLQTTREQWLNMFQAADGLITRAAQIRDYIASIHPQNKKALDYKKVQKYVQNLRGIRLSKKPVNPDGSAGKTSSTSEVSYGSMLRTGKDILEVIKTVPGYSPTNTNLTVANFTAFLTSIDTQNSAVAQKLENYDNSVEARGDLYKELGGRITKVKLAVAAQYGKSSNEYKDMVKY
ncbi:MAG: hypothetical protein A2V93_00435 [Ignavibacteria bacterium RBG_16_34_14]|nr:MAG: hypothetical protein A2V93_00435 [Ignavibacteria bacterium RBG_16_34_14]